MTTQTRWHDMTALQKVERVTELPMLLLAFTMVPIFANLDFWEPTPPAYIVYYDLEIIIWGVFALDLIVKTALAPKKLAYLRSHWFDVIVVIVPIIRPLWALRIVVYIIRAGLGFRRIIMPDYLIAYVYGSIIIGATIAQFAEPSAPGATIHTFSDALWWAVTTFCTMSYGDFVPVTPIGKITAAVLMFMGLGTLAAVAANFIAIVTSFGATPRQKQELEERQRQEDA